MKKLFLTVLFALIALFFVVLAADPSNKVITSSVYSLFAVLSVFVSFIIQFKLGQNE